MAVILELSVRPDDLEIGRVLPLSGDESVQLESLVPTGRGVVPFVRVQTVDPEAFERAIEGDPRVDTVERFNGETDEDLFAFDWRLEDDALFDAVESVGGYVLEAGGTVDAWQFRLRLPDQPALAAFDELLGAAAVPYELTAVYQETHASPGLRFGLTTPQREALVAAVEAGYFDIPRGVTTDALAEEFGISDQALVERLRRAVSNLCENTLLPETDE